MTTASRSRVCIPLQTGIAPIRVSFALAIFGLVGTGIGIFAVTQGTLATVVFGLVAASLVAAVGAIAGRRRASDVILSDAGVSVHGGVRHGVAFAWDALDTARLDHQRIGARSRRESSTNVSRLILVPRSGPEVPIAASVDEDEQRTVGVVWGAILARLTPSAVPPTAASVRVDVLVCPACGAPVTPAASDEVSCAYCKARVTVPKAVSERITRSRALAEARRELQRGVAILLRQPGAVAANQQIALFFAVFAIVLPVAAIAGATERSLVPVLISVAVFLLAWGLARATVADRISLRALVTGFGARRDAREGSPYTCRTCAAALPEAPEGEVLVRCVYCDADNVLGLDLVASVHGVVADEQGVDFALSERRRAHRWRLAKLVVAAALLVTAFVLQARRV